MKQTTLRLLKPALAAMALATLAACGGGDDAPVATVTPPAPEPTRAQDTRAFTPVIEATFAALGGSTVATDRWTGVLNGAAYRVEVPTTGWNGQLVMWAHGFRGTGPNLTVDTPIMRRYLLDNGYAWAASSYSKNYYDVRVGVEDTNALALNFVQIAAAKGRTLAAPSKIFITGLSMGGHITAAAIEAEAKANAINKVNYAAAMPICGVLGDTELFNYFGGYQVAAQQLAGFPITSFPTTDFAALAPAIRSALWTNFPTATSPVGQTNAQGDKLKNAVMNLSGGDRPFYNEGWANASNQGNIFASLGGDGTITGILNDNVLDTTQLFYKVDATSTSNTALDTAFNNSAFKIRPTADANRSAPRWPALDSNVSR